MVNALCSQVAMSLSSANVTLEIIKGLTNSPNKHLSDGFQLLEKTISCCLHLRITKVKEI